MLWQQKQFVRDPFQGQPSLGQGDSCKINPDGTFSCPIETPPVVVPATPAIVATEAATIPIVPIAIGGAVVLAAVLLLLK